MESRNIRNLLLKKSYVIFLYEKYRIFQRNVIIFSFFHLMIKGYLGDEKKIHFYKTSVVAGISIQILYVIVGNNISARNTAWNENLFVKFIGLCTNIIPTQNLEWIPLGLLIRIRISKVYLY